LLGALVAGAPLEDDAALTDAAAVPTKAAASTASIAVACFFARHALGSAQGTIAQSMITLRLLTWRFITIRWVSLGEPLRERRRSIVDTMRFLMHRNRP
jgi:hypothetical protein